MSLKIMLRIFSYIRCTMRFCIPVYIPCHIVQSVCYKESRFDSYNYSREYNCYNQLLPYVLYLNISYGATISSMCSKNQPSFTQNLCSPFIFISKCSLYIPLTNYIHFLSRLSLFCGLIKIIFPLI